MGGNTFLISTNKSELILNYPKVKAINQDMNSNTSFFFFFRSSKFVNGPKSKERNPTLQTKSRK